MEEEIKLKYYYQFNEDDEVTKVLKKQYNLMVGNVYKELNKLAQFKKAIVKLRGINPTRDLEE